MMRPKTTEEILSDLRAARDYHEREAAKLRAMIAAAELHQPSAPPVAVQSRCNCNEPVRVCACPVHGTPAPIIVPPLPPTPGLPFFPGVFPPDVPVGTTPWLLPNTVTFRIDCAPSMPIVLSFVPGGMPQYGAS